jgi:hypothetical protein
VYDEYMRRYRQADPATRHQVMSAIASLLRRGYAQRAGGRVTQTRYAPPGVAVAPDPGDDIDAHGDLVVEIVRAIYHETRRPVPTVAVTRAMQARGIRQPRRDYTRELLECRARTDRTRGASEWRRPQLRAVQTKTTYGVTKIFWLPIGVSAPKNGNQTGTARGKSDALREAVAAACRDLGRPVTYRELIWWREAHPAHPACAVPMPPRRLYHTLTAVQRFDGLATRLAVASRS